jgi:hypothetical protein
MAARLAALALLPSHVGQERISIFIMSPGCRAQVFPDQRYPYKSVVKLAFLITRSRAITGSSDLFPISVVRVNQWQGFF